MATENREVGYPFVMRRFGTDFSLAASGALAEPTRSFWTFGWHAGEPISHSRLEHVMTVVIAKL